MITVADGGFVREINFTPRWWKQDNFFWLDGDLREVRDIHITKNGTQYELYPLDCGRFFFRG